MLDFVASSFLAESEELRRRGGYRPEYGSFERHVQPLNTSLITSLALAFDNVLSLSYGEVHDEVELYVMVMNLIRGFLLEFPEADDYPSKHLFVRKSKLHK